MSRVVPRSSRIGGQSAQTTGSGIRYLIAIDILRIHESRPVFTDAPHPESQLAISGVAVEKLDLRKNGMILGDGKWSIILYESLIGHPDATLFWTSSRI
jgi:hypothetical protein